MTLIHTKTDFIEKGINFCSISGGLWPRVSVDIDGNGPDKPSRWRNNVWKFTGMPWTDGYLMHFRVPNRSWRSHPFSNISSSGRPVGKVPADPCLPVSIESPQSIWWRLTFAFWKKFEHPNKAHKLISYVLLFWTMVHILAHYLNIYNFSDSWARIYWF